MEGIDTVDILLTSLTQRRSQVPPAEAGQAFGDSIRVLFRQQKSLGVPDERFFASLRFEQRGKLDQLGLEIGSFD